MAPDLQRIKNHLIAFNFKELFNELGWDRVSDRPLTITTKGGSSFILKSLVEKRGVKVYLCPAHPQSKIPDDKTIRQIDLQVAKEGAAEHLIIYTDATDEHQVWQWVRREPGKPLTQHTHKYHKGQSGESLAGKLIKIAFSIAEEDTLTNPTVSGRVKSAFDVEKVTKRFYERFKKEHSAFMDFIKGITEQGNREWYTSLMLNRL
ncbi:MAG TPA: hypothetical protein VFN23_12280, partial [Ktedonobacteraceae bacterium]|nr:hypothetical protein [Ktedonobacteraceae bacterium]